MAKKAPIPTIGLIKADIDLFETFLQYGDLVNSKLIFIGREEGLAGDYFPGMSALAKYNLALKARRLLFAGTKFASNRVFVYGTNANDGWYINDSDCLKHAQWDVLYGTSYIKSPVAEPKVIELQARFYWLMQGSNRSSGYKSITSQTFSICPYLHTLNNAAMIEYYPLPYVDTFPYIYPPIFTDLKTYEKHYNTLNSAINNRYRILKNAYNTYPMDVSIAYTGIIGGQFKLYAFYYSLGFRFITHNTSVVNPTFSNYISPSPNGTNFLRGERIKENGEKQIVILTPFFGRWTITNEDVDVISSWV